MEPVIFLFMFAFYFYKVIFELYVFNRYGKEAVNTSSHSDSFNHCLSVHDINNLTNNSGKGDYVEKELAYLTLIVGVTARLPSVVATLILGPVSDRFGRKPALLVNLLGMLLHAVVAILVVSLNWNVYYFALGGGLRGLCGGIAGILTACYSYIADVSSKKWLVVRLGLLEAMTFAAGTLSLVAAGVWTQENDCNFEPLVWVVLGCMMVAIPYTLFLLPESLDRDEVDNKRRKRPVVGPKALLRGLQIFFGPEYSRCKLWLLLLVMAVTILNTSGTAAIITLYLLHEPLQWSPIHIGSYLATSEMMHGLAIILLLPLLVYLGVKDSFITVIGIVISVGANVSLGFADELWQVYTIGALQSVDALILPGVKAIMSKAVLPEDHGALFSFVSAAQVISSVLGFAVFVLVYIATLRVNWYHGTGISFLIMATLYGFLLLPMMVVLCLQRREERKPTSPSPSPANQSPQRVIPPSINSLPRPIEHEGLLEAVQSELGQDTLERRSVNGSISSLGRSLEMSLQSSGSYRSSH